MRTGLLFFMLCMISSCGSTKKIARTETSQIQIKDSLTLTTTTPKETSVFNETDTLENKKETIIKQKNEISQIVTKDDHVHDIWNDLLKKHVSDNGNVDYEGFKTDQLALYHYFKTLNDALPNPNNTKEYKLAYWINAYNAMTIDLILHHFPINSIKDIKKPWNQRLWKLGEKWYNLNDIEHTILRNMNEPRIHFTIVCASLSCPKLRREAYSIIQLENQLTQATKDFLSDHSKNSLSVNTLELSKIFQWFAKDFKQDGSLILFLNQYSDIKISKNAKISFKDYNWNLNN